MLRLTSTRKHRQSANLRQEDGIVNCSSPWRVSLAQTNDLESLNFDLDLSKD